MEIILNSNEHKINDYCLRYNLKRPIRFRNQHISLTGIIFYNFFENVNNFKLTLKYNNQSHDIVFKQGSYDVDDISYMINLEIKEKFNIEDEPIKLIVDFNRYQILIIVKEDWQLILDKNFMIMLGFTKYVIKQGYHRSEN